MPVKLAPSGYYRKALDQVRDVLETYFLVDYLTTHRAKVAEWRQQPNRLIRLRLDHPGTVVRIRWKPANFEDLVLALPKTGLNRLQALGRSAIVTERARSSVA
jgi:hypothetical protein